MVVGWKIQKETDMERERQACRDIGKSEDIQSFKEK